RGRPNRGERRDRFAGERRVGGDFRSPRGRALKGPAAGRFSLLAVAELLLDAVDGLVDGLDGEVLALPAAAWRVEALAVHRVGLGAEVAQGLVAAPGSALVAEGGNVDGSDDDFLSGAGIGLGEDAALEVDHHAAARPGERRVVGEAPPPGGGRPPGGGFCRAG